LTPQLLQLHRRQHHLMLLLQQGLLCLYQLLLLLLLVLLLSWMKLPRVMVKLTERGLLHNVLLQLLLLPLTWPLVMLQLLQYKHILII
jgi:hypothetical protein